MIGFISKKYFTQTIFFKRCLTTGSYRLKEKPAEVPIELTDLLNEIRAPDISEEEIMKKRNKSRIAERTYQKYIKKEPMPLDAQYDYEMYRLRSYYARFGKASKLNPGICWPTKEKIKENIFYFNMFEPSLQERIESVESKKLAAAEHKRLVDEEVDQNMANLDKWIGDYYNRIEKRKLKAQELKLEREKLVDEVSEYLGYEIDPKDPRFKEAVEQRNKEKKKAMKVKRQQESYDKMLAKLRKIAENK